MMLQSVHVQPRLLLHSSILDEGQVLAFANCGLW